MSEESPGSEKEDSPDADHKSEEHTPGGALGLPSIREAPIQYAVLAISVAFLVSILIVVAGPREKKLKPPPFPVIPDNVSTSEFASQPIKKPKEEKEEVVEPDPFSMSKSALGKPKLNVLRQRVKSLYRGLKKGFRREEYRSLLRSFELEIRRAKDKYPSATIFPVLEDTLAAHKNALGYWDTNIEGFREPSFGPTFDVVEQYPYIDPTQFVRMKSGRFAVRQNSKLNLISHQEFLQYLFAECERRTKIALKEVPE